MKSSDAVGSWALEGDAAGELMSPIVRPGPLRDEVRRTLVDLIVHYKLVPGQHLRESQLAEQIGVSRVPVREALLALAQEGWVDHRLARGAFVHIPSDKEVEDVFAVRVMLEAEAASLAAAAVTSEGIRELRDICRSGRKAVMKNDSEAVVKANAEFHRRVMEFADNSELSRILSSIARKVNWYFTPIALSRGGKSWDEHDQLIDALEDHDALSARTIMAAHTQETWKMYFQMKARTVALQSAPAPLATPNPATKDV
jgi:DNA-binding GntR family transcriptional regulator